MVILIDILKFILLMLMTFFTCQIITDGKRRISYIGTILICFSTAMVEYIHSGLLEAIFFGEGIFIALHRLLENLRYPYFYAIAIPFRNFGIFIIFK